MDLLNSENEMITCYFKSFPTLFKDNYEIEGLKLNDILNYELKIRQNGELLSQYKSIYQYNMTLSLKYIKQLSRQRLRILITDQLFLWLPNYFELHHKCLTSLLDEDGYIPNKYRIYIAIMVFFK